MKTTRRFLKIMMLGLMIVMIFTALSVCVSAVDEEVTEANAVEETAEHCSEKTETHRYGKREILKRFPASLQAV